VSRALSAAGYKVGVYTSPHLHHIGERLAVLPPHVSSGFDGALPPAAFDALVREHEATLRGDQDGEGSGGGVLSHFEAVTALAFRHFADAGVDIAVVETGLGGTTDATNVIEAEQLQVATITPIGLEHVDALGGTLRSIAAAKAGIMKAGVPVVLAAQPPGSDDPDSDVAGMLSAAAGRLGCAVTHACDAVAVTPRGYQLAADGQVSLGVGAGVEEGVDQGRSVRLVAQQAVGK